MIWVGAAGVAICLMAIAYAIGRAHECYLWSKLTDEKQEPEAHL